MNVWKKISAVTQIMRHRGGLISILTWRPFSITAFSICRQLKNSVGPLRTIIDGGANIGQFARAAIETFPTATVHSFEPLDDVADVFAKNLSDKPSVHIHRFALGATEGDQTFFRNEFSQASSFLKLKSSTTQTHELVSSSHTPCTVKITTVDSWASSTKLVEPVLLKLDLQGFELEALRGASTTLNRIDYILLEAAVETSYKGEPGRDEIVSFLHNQGFSRSSELNQIYSRDGKLLQVDILFHRRTDS